MIFEDWFIYTIPSVVFAMLMSVLRKIGIGNPESDLGTLFAQSSSVSHKESPPSRTRRDGSGPSARRNWAFI
ncbi:hypothetical protein PAA26_01085 [Methanomassiliicoccaceae archaeon COG_1]|nr:hypothetical protein [Methanomassiliicoccaceae archaeon COG_1]